MRKVLWAVLAFGVAYAIWAVANAVASSPNTGTFLAERDGGYADACQVVRVYPGSLTIGDGTLTIPVVRITLTTREHIVLAESEGSAMNVVQTIVNECQVTP